MIKKAIDHKGIEYKSIAAMCRAYGIDYDVFYMRKRMGMSLEQALTGDFISFHKEFEKAEKRRAKFVEQNRGEQLQFPMKIRLSDIKAPSFYERKAGIYSIKNLKNGYMYIGQAIDLYARLSDHKSEPFYRSKNYNLDLNVAIREYGTESFECNILTYYLPTVLGIEEILNTEEEKYIKQYKTFSPFPDETKGYNMTMGGQGSRRIQFSDETLKRLIDDYNSGVKFSELEKKYGACAATIRKILDDSGVPRRDKFSTSRDKMILQLYNEGNTKREIAKETGYSIDQVITSLSRCGVSSVARTCKSNEVYPEYRKYYYLLDAIRDEIFEKYRSGASSINALGKEYYKYLSITPSGRIAKERLIKSYLVEIGGFDVKNKQNRVNAGKVYMTREGAQGTIVLRVFEHANAATRYVSLKMGKPFERCRKNISYALNSKNPKSTAYGFGFTREITPEQALNYVLGNRKSNYTRVNGPDAFNKLLNEYEALIDKPDPIKYFKQAVSA